MKYPKTESRWVMSFILLIFPNKNDGQHMKKIMILFFFLAGVVFLYAQEEEPIVYYQMEPFDDSLFIQIQNQVFIDPPDPKAEIIVDLRDANNQTVSIKGVLYPFLAFTPETRARIQTYPFKLNLSENIHYASVFTRVIEKMKFGKMFAPPTLVQISPSLHYVNPFLQVFGGERFGLPLKSDVGLSFGIGTPYSGPLESNFVESSFHILGFWGGIYSNISALTDARKVNSFNNIYATTGYQIGYVIPLGNFFQVSYMDVLERPTEGELDAFRRYDTLGYHALVMDREYFNAEFRYPVTFFGSTRGKFFIAKYIGEWHIGYSGREISLAGSIFDLRLDAMVKSDVRRPQYLIDILVQRVFDSWAFSAFALGPSVILGQTSKGKFGFNSLFLNARIKVGTSL
jgi:hypothetical protein